MSENMIKHPILVVCYKSPYYAGPTFIIQMFGEVVETQQQTKKRNDQPSIGIEHQPQYQSIVVDRKIQLTH